MADPEGSAIFCVWLYKTRKAPVPVAHVNLFFDVPREFVGHLPGNPERHLIGAETGDVRPDAITAK